MNTKLTAHHMLLAGTNYEVGTVLGNLCLTIPGMANQFCMKKDYISKSEEAKMYRLFQNFCPGINEEIAGFADALHIPKKQVLYYAMTYLRPGCSQMALLPAKTKNRHTMLARNYEFSDKVEEMMLSTTRIKGKYAHIGFSIMQFGRSDGMNEHGLAVSQTSAGVPVGDFEFAARPAIVGLQFWAVIRSVLENCKTVAEAIEWTKNMPIAYNINLMVADKGGHAALIESFNGKIAVGKINSDTKNQFIASTNHVHLPELQGYAPLSMQNSLVRYKLINDKLEGNKLFGREDLKQFLSAQYPAGLCCHYYDDFFGTLHSMVFDVNEGAVDVCFGSPDTNAWHTFRVFDEVLRAEYPVELSKARAPKGFYDMIGSEKKESGDKD